MDEKFTYLNDDLRYQVVSVGGGTLVHIEQKDHITGEGFARRVIFMDVDDLKTILKDIEERV